MRSHLPTGVLLFALLTSSCQRASPLQVTVVDGESVHVLQASDRVPLVLLTRQGIPVTPGDRSLANGLIVPIDQPLEIRGGVTLQLRPAVDVRIMMPDQERLITTAAFTVAEALSEAGIEVRSGDSVLPPPATSISGPTTVSYRPARELQVASGDRTLTIRSSSQTIGEALAGTGLAVTGLDYTVPSENEALPPDGQIRIVHVREDILLGFESIPYESSFRESPDVEFGQEKLIQPGENGLAMTRTRIRHENGAEVARVEEERSVVRQSSARVIERGTKIVLKTATVDGETIEYWRAIEMYATSYSPCRSGVEGQCFTGTSLGLPVKKGVVAVDISFYNEMAGQQIYVTGYGTAVIADVGAGRIIEANLGIPRTRWIDLGYGDADWQEWGGYVTVYFLAPAPTAMPSVLQ